MQRSLLILEDLLVHLPAIKGELKSENWSIFSNQIQEQATSFEKLADDQSLTGAANQLLRLFLENETVLEIITRPDSGNIRSIRLPKPQAEEEIHLETRPNIFCLFRDLKEIETIENAELAQWFQDVCRDPDTFAEKVRAFLERQSPDR